MIRLKLKQLPSDIRLSTAQCAVRLQSIQKCTPQYTFGQVLNFTDDSTFCILLSLVKVNLKQWLFNWVTSPQIECTALPYQAVKAAYFFARQPESVVLVARKNR